MKNFFDAGTMQIIVNLFVALFLGMVVGFERLWAHKTAGMRTYALVSMGSALFVTVSNQMVDAYASRFANMNPIVIVSQIVLGVGFLGTGLIFSKELVWRRDSASIPLLLSLHSSHFLSSQYYGS